MIKVSKPSRSLPKFPAAFKLIPSRGENQDKNLVVLFFKESHGITLVSEKCDSRVTGQMEMWIPCSDTGSWNPVEVNITP